MKNFKMMFVVILTVLLISVPVMATSSENEGCYEHSVTGKIKYFKSHPVNAQWFYIGPCSPEDIIDENGNKTNIIVGCCEDKREFAPAHTPVIASFADYVGSETPGYTYSTIKEMLTFGNVFTESQLKSMAGKRGLRGAVVDITMMDNNMACQKPTIHPVAKERTVTVYYKADIPNPIRRGAFITVAMKSVKGISVEALGKSGLAVLEVGGNTLFLTAQGMDITQSQHSIAVGPGISFSSVGENTGTTGGGGLTYSYGVFGKNYKPYLRSMALYVEDVDHKYVPRSKLKDDKK